MEVITTEQRIIQAALRYNDAWKMTYDPYIQQKRVDAHWDLMNAVDIHLNRPTNVTIEPAIEISEARNAE